MKSLRQLISIAEPAAPPISLRKVAATLGVMPPVSLRKLIDQKVPDPIGGGPPYSLIYCRDRIVLNSQFKAHVKLDTIPRETTLLLAAREITVAEDFDLLGYHLVLLAERFVGAGHTISLRVFDESHEDTPGKIGPTATVICRQLAGITITSSGGRGGPGSQGEPGAEGLPRKGVGGKGGKGHTGHTGAIGGLGGYITLIYVENQTPGGLHAGINLQSLGGRGGLGGKGGRGGPGGEGLPPKPGVEGHTGSPGDPGDYGAPGASGAAGIPLVAQVSETEYWDRVRSLTTASATAWAAHRVRVADYAFRTGDRNKALSEVNAALRLDPQNSQAATYKGYLLNHQNILGLEYDLDVIPDFEGYNEVVTTFEPLIKSLFETALTLLQTDVLLDQHRQDLEREIAHINDPKVGLLQILEKERVAADVDAERAEIERTAAGNRVTAMQKYIDKRVAALEKDEGIDWGGVIALGATTIAVGLASFVLPGGQALAPFAIDMMIKGGATLIDPAVSGQEAAILKAPLGIKNQEWNKNVKDVVVPIAISFGKIISELNEKEASGKAEIKQLLTQLTELVHQQLIAGLREKQAKLLLDAAEAKKRLAENDLARAQQQQQNLGQDITVLHEAAMSLIRSARHYMGRLLKYVFMAARALEIYTLADPKDVSGQVPYTHSHVDPDLEQDYLDHLITPAFFVAAYVQSWSAPLTFDYQERFDDYFNQENWTPGSEYRRFDDPAALAQFRESRTFFFNIDLAQLPDDRYEAKVAQVHVSFVGATTQSPTIDCKVTHSGRFLQKKLDGTIVELILSPKTEVVKASKTQLTKLDVPFDQHQLRNFLGRGVAASWTLDLEEDPDNPIDLSGLTFIEVMIDYVAFLT